MEESRKKPSYTQVGAQLLQLILDENLQLKDSSLMPHFILLMSEAKTIGHKLILIVLVENFANKYLNKFHLMGGTKVLSKWTLSVLKSNATTNNKKIVYHFLKVLYLLDKDYRRVIEQEFMDLVRSVQRTDYNDIGIGFFLDHLIENQPHPNSYSKGKVKDEFRDEKRNKKFSQDAKYREDGKFEKRESPNKFKKRKKDDVEESSYSDNRSKFSKQNQSKEALDAETLKRRNENTQQLFQLQADIHKKTRDSSDIRHSQFSKEQSQEKSKEITETSYKNQVSSESTLDHDVSGPSKRSVHFADTIISSRETSLSSILKQENSNKHVLQGHSLEYTNASQCSHCSRIFARRCIGCLRCLICAGRVPCEEKDFLKRQQQFIKDKKMSSEDRTVAVLNPRMDRAIYEAFRDNINENLQFERIFSLISYGVSPNFRRLQADHSTALMAAASRGNMAAVKKLMSFGADLHLTDRCDRRAVDYAVKEGQEEVARYLTVNSYNNRAKYRDAL